MDQNAQQQIIDRLKEANNVLVTVSTNPSVDQLSACIGFTLLLNKLGKHGTAVFSGDIPSTLEFLKPDETIEKNTDSLRDFIIALDKSKADKLRYKVEDKVVKIFITPYRTSITDKDLDFSQGDFNVDVVIGLGVHERADLDKAIMGHGRILHDATVISVNNKDQGNVGSINWVDLTASSLSEMLVGLAHSLTSDPLDAQMATAFMTGIVAETDRFSNAKTTPVTMSLASELMTSGANQQLIASKLQAAPGSKSIAVASDEDAEDDDGGSVDEDGALRISHEDTPAATLPPVVEDEEGDIDEEDSLPLVPAGPQISKLHETSLPDTPPIIGAPTDAPLNSANMILQPPSLGGKLTANTVSEDTQLDPSTDPLSSRAQDSQSPLLSRNSPKTDVGADAVINSESLQKIEEDVNSPHIPAAKPAEDTVDNARGAVDDAINDAGFDQPLEPVKSLGAQPLDLDLHGGATAAPAAPESPFVPSTPVPASSEPLPYFPPSEPLIDTSTPLPSLPLGAPTNGGVDPNVPSNLMPTTPVTDTTASGTGSPSAPPPVPPPMMPPASDGFGTPPAPGI